MPIYSIYNNALKAVNEKPFKLERDIQALFEANLKQVMGLTLVCSEFSIKNKRIDTLAYDQQNNAFIIIEYKRDKNISVVDQGFTYLSLMLENKADFVLKHQEQLGSTLQLKEIDWSQTRVAFVSPSFTDNQIQATNFKDIAIELWEVKRFENNTLLVTEVKKSRSAESIKPIAQQNKEFKRIADEITVYTEESVIANGSAETAELYDKFRSAILNLADDIEVVPLKWYVAFKKNSNVVDIEIQKKSLKIFINAKWGSLDDSKGIARDVSKVGHSGNGDYQIQVTDDKDLEYIMSLVKQVL